MEKEEQKIERIQKYIDKIKTKVFLGKNERDTDNYCKDISYVASLSNGTDYYYKNDKYIALDKNNIFKVFNNCKHFLLNEVANNKTQFKYITSKETNKIFKELESDYLNMSSKDNIFKKHNESFSKFINYIENKDYDISSYDKNFSIFIDIQKLRNEVIRDIVKTSKKSKEIEIGE